jgi:hypothetical protein
MTTHTFTTGDDPLVIDGDVEGIVAGDTILITTGTYTQLQFLDLPGTEANPILIQNLNGQVEVTDANDVYIRDCTYIEIDGTGHGGTQYGFLFNRRIAATRANNAHTYHDLEFDIDAHPGNQIGINMLEDTTPAHEFNDIEIYNCYIHGTDLDEAIYIGSSVYGTHPEEYMHRRVNVHHNTIEHSRDGIQFGSVVEDGEIHHNSIIDVDSDDGALFIAGIVLNKGCSVEAYNNWIQDCEELGIFMADQDEVGVVAGCSFYNNVIINCGTANNGGSIDSINIGDSNFNIPVFNNTIITAVGYGIQIVAGQDDCDVVNNIILDTTLNPIDYGGSAAGSHNLTGLAAQSEDAIAHTIVSMKFVDSASDDYHLQSNSPAVDTGTAVGAPSDDFDGEPRDGTPDVGAFEYIAPVPPPPVVSSGAKVFVKS